MADQNIRTLADLRKAGPPQLFETDQDSIKARLVAKFEALTKKTLFPAQPEMFMIETMAYALSVRAEAHQKAALQNTIAWSEGRHLEDRATNVSIFKLLEQSALTTMKFVLDGIRLNDTNIDAGTRISGGGTEFALDDDVIIPAGALEASGQAHALTPGVAANDIPPFSINVPVDVLPDGVTAYNETITVGGSDDEEQERFRERAANGNFRISKGGPGKGYREIVKGLHPDIVDVGVVKPEPGVIDIYPLMNTGIPSAELKALVFDGLDPEVDIPMGDYVYIKDATPVAFDFTLIIRIDAADATIEDLGRAKAMAIFLNWSQLLGVRISPSVVTSEVRLFPGVIDAEIDGLDYTDLTATQFATLDENDLTIDVMVRPNV